MRDEKGRFVKGNKGRPKGAKGKVSANIKDKIQEIVDNQLDELPELLEKLDPKDKIDAIIKLIPYVLAKKKEEVIEQPHKIELISIITPAIPNGGYEIDDDS